MNKLVKMTRENKSTLIYYVNEGLLPEPQRPRKNVALYEEKCVKIVKYIRYFQNSLYYSIGQIKELIKNGTINFDDSVDMIINSLSSISIGKREFSIKDVLDKTGISSEELEKLQKLELIRKDDFYSQKDIDVIEVLCEIDETKQLLLDYVNCAKKLAKIEHKVGAEILNESKGDNRMHQVIYDTILKVKPYIFNNHTLLENKRNHNKK